MRVMDKITDVAIPVALTLALIVGLLWEHDTQLEQEEEEWDRFFQGRKLRAHANKERLLAELNTAQKNAITQQEAVTFLQQQKKEIKSNISEAVEALQVAREDLKGVAQDAIARDRSKATVDRKLFACDEDHDRTMTKLKVLGKEAQGLHLELEVLEKRKFKLTEKLNLGFGVRAGKKSDVLLAHDKHVEEKLLATGAADIHKKKNHEVQQAPADAAAHQHGEGGEDQQKDDQHEGHPHQHDAGDGDDNTEAAAEDVTAENKKKVKVKLSASPEEIEADATNQKVWEKKNYPPDEEVNNAYAHHHAQKKEEKEVKNEEHREGDNHRQTGGGGDEVDAAAVHNTKEADRAIQNDLDAEG